jgi:DNA polymerase III subunit gamma/tau
MRPLYEKYRPRSFDAVICQNKAVRQLKKLAESGFGGKAFWLSGASGTGKTTLARIIANTMVDIQVLLEKVISEAEGK